ncbi:DUF3422 domain-containing protein [Asticcacaulis sp. AC460]|uniref:DUF3422 domain-containing protein n=1 Tax=Asticcacaulis sp. AC460 TaxID=1282360 RepID=UPI0004CEBAB6|nr:DUF3422 domain-containing protein [Asticcacaulis sp. AC460]
MSRPSDHPLRASLSDLMHARVIPVFAAPAVVRSWVYLLNDEERAAERTWIDALAGEHGAEGWTLHDIGDTGGMIWERHGEFSTYLKFTTAVDQDEATQNGLGFCSLKTAYFPWLSGAPGSVFRSVEIAVLPYEPEPEQLQASIDLSQAVCCDVFGGKARIWSDFRMHEGGAGRIYVHDRGLQNDQLSRLLQNLIEIGHYRKLALLGFPVARELMAWLKEAEARLAAVTSDMASQSASQAQVLDRLMALSDEVEQRVNAVSFRQGATRAYAQLAEDRLVSLRESRVEGFSTMAEFIERRLRPAMRTCDAAERRLDEISSRIGRVSDLLRARISISLEVQNQDLLKSMDLRARLQVKLSGLVEGLSVFAVSYYVFSLLKYVVDSAVPKEVAHWLYAPMIAGILALAWLFIYHRKKKIEEQAE